MKKLWGNKLTKIEAEVLRVIQAEGEEMRSFDIHLRLKPLAFGNVHLILDNLVKMGLIESRREQRGRVVWSVKE